jgi:pyrroloquinoline quinone biosynthesis protein B
MRTLFVLCSIALLFACEQQSKDEESLSLDQAFLVVLGTAQDAGYPQAACQKDCCRRVWENPALRESVSCLAFVDPTTDQAWMFDATPDFKDQLHYLRSDLEATLAGVFLTHAHVGHYTGLMHLGREIMGAQAMPVYAMPKMRDFLSQNGPWSQLVDLQNISLQPIKNDSTQQVSATLKITPLLVPHRDEFSETVGYSIEGPTRKALFIPDINKWEKWNLDINALISAHDYAFLDATFFANGEIPGRDMTEIPHPFVEESLQRFSTLAPEQKTKIHFIHFNHTNPILQANSSASLQVEAAGMHIARTGRKYPM